MRNSRPVALSVTVHGAARGDRHVVGQMDGAVAEQDPPAQAAVGQGERQDAGRPLVLGGAAGHGAGGIRPDPQEVAAGIDLDAERAQEAPASRWHERGNGALRVDGEDLSLADAPHVEGARPGIDGDSLGDEVRLRNGEGDRGPAHAARARVDARRDLAIARVVRQRSVLLRVQRHVPADRVEPFDERQRLRRGAGLDAERGALVEEHAVVGPGDQRRIDRDQQARDRRIHLRRRWARRRRGRAAAASRERGDEGDRHRENEHDHGDSMKRSRWAAIRILLGAPTRRARAGSSGRSMPVTRQRSDSRHFFSVTNARDASASSGSSER